MEERTVVVTGANGFVGRHVCDAFGRAGWYVRATVRDAGSAPTSATDTFDGFRLERSPNWRRVLRGADAVVHCAGVAHTTFSDVERGRGILDRINRVAAVELGRAAIEADVRRFVFLSSVGVYGRMTAGRAAEEGMECHPAEAYAISKLAAERALCALCENATMQLVTVRPPLVYGPRCPGNFARLVRLVRTGLPLPFGRVGGARHFVSVHNLADFALSACGHPEDVSGVFNVADADEIDLGDILTAIGAGLDRPVRNWPCPPGWLRGAARVVGRAEAIDKLSESVRVDSSRARERFGWVPAVRSVEGMRAAAASFAGAVAR